MPSEILPLENPQEAHLLLARDSFRTREKLCNPKLGATRLHLLLKIQLQLSNR